MINERSCAGMFEEGARFSPQLTRVKSFCCVRSCDSRTPRDTTVRFHSFPKPGLDYITVSDVLDADKICRREACHRVLTMEPESIRESTRVCSLHFRPSDYTLPNMPKQRRYLKRNVVSSCNLPELSQIGHHGLVSLSRNETREEWRTEPYSFVAVKRESPDDETIAISDLKAVIRRDHCYVIRASDYEREASESFAVKNEVSDGSTVKLELNRLDRGDCGAQTMDLEETEIKTESVDLPDVYLNNHRRSMWVEGKKVERKLSDALRSDYALRVWTGIPSYRVLREIAARLRLVSPRYARSSGLRLTLEDRLIMTFAKLKQAPSYKLLATLFGCTSRDACSRIVTRTLDRLGDCMRSAIHWHHRPRKEILPPFSSNEIQKYAHIRCAVNRIEIALHRSKKASDRIAGRSRYGRCDTVKFVTAVALDGFVRFVGQACHGNMSHEQAFERSNVVGSLKKNDTLMILKELAIDELCRGKNVRLVRYLFSRKDENFVGNDVYRARLNVNRKIRSYRIFRRKLSYPLSRRVEKIITTICAVENLRVSVSAERSSL